MSRSRPTWSRGCARAEDFGKGIQVRVQMFYAALSLALHDRASPTTSTRWRRWSSSRRAYCRSRIEPGSHFVAAFGHLNGYSATYYTYMWSLVIAKDLLSRFEGDLMDGATANDYRRSMLEPGGSRDAADLVRSFLGRDYAFEAWQRWLER